MFFIKNRLVVKILTVLTVLLLFFSFGLFLSDITSDVKVDSVVIDYEPVHSLSSSDNLYYGNIGYVDSDDCYMITGNTNFVPVDILESASYGGLTFMDIYGISEYLTFETDGEFLIENDILIFGFDVFSEDYDVLLYEGFSFDLSLFQYDNAYIYVGVSYDGTVLNSFDEALNYADRKNIVYAEPLTIYIQPSVVVEEYFVIFSRAVAYELGYLKTQGTGIVEVITSTIAPFGLGILNAISSYFTALFFDNGSLSNFAIFSFVLVGISLVMGLTYVIYNLVKRKR